MCPLCDSHADLFLAAENREYWFCGHCRLIFVPEPFMVSKEEEMRRYREHENSLDNEGYVSMFLQKIEVVKRVCPSAKTVLDYGCGYEPVLKTLLGQNGYRADGYDPYFFPDTELAPAYDLILSTETFEHFKAPGKEMARLTSLLASGGHLAVMTRLYPRQNGQASQEAFASWYYKRDPTHIAFYCPDTFSWIGRRYGFETVYEDDKDFIVMKKI